MTNIFIGIALILLGIVFIKYTLDLYKDKPDDVWLEYRFLRNISGGIVSIIIGIILLLVWIK